MTKHRAKTHAHTGEFIIVFNLQNQLVYAICGMLSIKTESSVSL